MMNGMAYALVTADSALVRQVAHTVFRVHQHRQLNATCTTASTGSEYTISSSGHGLNSYTVHCKSHVSLSVYCIISFDLFERNI